MTWNSTTEEQLKIAKGVVLWIETARAAKYPDDWLPTDADIYKSALFERIRSGKEPLAEPPPLGLSCPWYALIEDPGPHYVFEVYRSEQGDFYGPGVVSVLQHPYDIVEERTDKDLIVKDHSYQTSYRFRLWYDAEWKHPSGRFVGGWFIQNIALPQGQTE